MKTNEKTSDRKEEASDKAQLGQAKANEEMALRKIRSIRAELDELYKMTNITNNGSIKNLENDLGIDVWEEFNKTDISLRRIAAAWMSNRLKS
tara:strand:- start:379 stop:657 length:279 start_codon:yes stop_codon:yes gene_type:complete